MKNKYRYAAIAGLCLLLIAAVNYFWTDKSDPDGALLNSSASVTPTSVDKQPPVLTKKKEPKDDVDLVVMKDEFNPYADEQLKAQIMQIADLYEQNSKFPHDSQPILNEEDAGEQAPFEASEVDTPFPLEGLKNVRVRVATDKFQYFPGDIIRVKVNLTGVPEDVFVSVNAVIASNQGDTPLQAVLNQVPAEGLQFETQFDTGLVPASAFSPELLLKVTTTVDQKPMFTTLGFRFNIAPATLQAIPYVRTNGAYLEIPLQYVVNTPGYYFVSAILADQASAKPLIRLQAEGRMPQGNGLLLLKAHQAALRAVGSEGPYVLRSINSYRGAEDGETFDQPASSVQAEFSIQGFAFSEYSDEPYSNQENDERLEFLKEIGNEPL